MDQVCPKEVPQLMQERSQAVRCSLADATQVTIQHPQSHLITAGCNRLVLVSGVKKLLTDLGR